LFGPLPIWRSLDKLVGKTTSKRNDTYNAFCCIEPKWGVNTINKTDPRKAEDFTDQIKETAETDPTAQTIDSAMENIEYSGKDPN